MASAFSEAGMRTFALIWLGQFASIIGSGLTAFALGVALYQATGSVTQFALLTFASTLPFVLLSPLAGVVADRWDRRLLMIGGDLGAGMSTLILTGLYLSGQLETWHIYLLLGVSAGFSAFQEPAYTASIATLVPTEQLGRASGMVQMSHAMSRLAAPAIAGFLLATVNLTAILLIDVLSFLVAVGTLLPVRFRTPRARDDAPDAPWGQELIFGWRYLWDRSGLLALVLLFTAVNFLAAIAVVLIPPLVLSFATEDILGLILSVGGGGLLVGSAVMTAWGGPERRMPTIFAFLLLFGVSLALFGGNTMALLQRDVAPKVQGRVFATLGMLVQALRPVGFLLAGFLADVVFEPSLQEDGALAASVGAFIGVGEGRGTGFLFIILGSVALLLVLGSRFYSPLWHLENRSTV